MPKSTLITFYRRVVPASIRKTRLMSKLMLRVGTFSPKKILRRSGLGVFGFFANLTYLSSSKSGKDKRGPVAEADARTLPPVDLIICLAVGPGELIGLKDLLDSAERYLNCTYKVILVDDSALLAVWREVRDNPKVVYLRNTKRNGAAKLPQSLARAYRNALQNYSFPAILKLDADSLITGDGLVRDIHSFLAANPNAGMLGSYRVSCDGGRRDFSGWTEQFKKNWQIWGDIIERAQKYDYEIGETAQGGGYVISSRCLQAMEQAGYFDLLFKIGMKTSDITEDVIYSLFTRSLGFAICDFAMEGQPFAIQWTGLPLSRDEIVRQNKKVIHSVKFSPADLATRDYFRRLRTGGDPLREPNTISQ